jgi:hypothetical protein
MSAAPTATGELATDLAPAAAPSMPADAAPADSPAAAAVDAAPADRPAAADSPAPAADAAPADSQATASPAPVDSPSAATTAPPALFPAEAARPPQPPAPVRPTPARPAPPTRPDSGRPGSGRRQRVAGAVVSVVLVLVFAGLAARFLARQVGSSPQHRISQASARAAAQVRDQAADWVAGQVSPTATVSCDRMMCQELETNGIPAARLLALSSRRGDPLRSDVLVETPVVRGILGSRFDSEHAPAVIQTFGSGSDQIDIRVIAPRGAAAYLAALSADVAARKSAGRQLLHTGRITASAPARRQLAAGLVDTRLLVTLVGLAAQQPIYIMSFGDLGRDATQGIPLRSVDLAETPGVVSGNRAAYQHSMLTFLHEQQSPYLAALTRPIQVGDQRVVQIQFDAPSPLGLVSPTGP